MHCVYLRDPRTGEEVGYVSEEALKSLGFCPLLSLASHDETVEIADYEEDEELDTALEHEQGHAPPPTSASLPPVLRRATIFRRAGTDIIYGIKSKTDLSVHLPDIFTQHDGDTTEEVEIVPAERTPAAVVLVPVRGDGIPGEGYYAIFCNKGRGAILPGGKLEPGESLDQAAARELFEESGIVAYLGNLTPIFSAPQGQYDVTAFVCDEWDGYPKGGDEGEVAIVGRGPLLKSQYGDYYRRMFKVYDAWAAEQNL